MWESSDIIGNVDVFLLYLVPKGSVIRLNDIHCEMLCILYICVATKLTLKLYCKHITVQDFVCIK